MDYYKLLGLTRDAGSMDVKKAYFGMVRKYPPDRYPDEFKKIREAYEILIDGNSRKEYDAIGDMPDIVKSYYDYSKTLIEEEDYEGAIKQLEKIKGVYSDLTVINSLLGEAYMQNENSGKAIRIFEELVSKEPENASLRGKLAEAYLNRGWHKKAAEKYQSALALDEDNFSFWNGLIHCYFQADDMELLYETAVRAIETSKRNNWDSLAIYIDLVNVDILSGRDEELLVHLEDLMAAARNFPENKNNIVFSLAQLSERLQSAGLIEAAASLITTANQMDPDDSDIAAAAAEICKEHAFRQELEKLEYDSFFPGYMSEMLEHEIDSKGEENDTFTGFIRFTFEMEIISDMMGQRKYVKELKERYPDLYGLKSEFFDRVINISQAKKLEWDYAKKYKKFYKLYPEKFVDDDEDDDLDIYMPQEPVRREGPKVGRNDPCPCGSGKKYKKCCGK